MNTSPLFRRLASTIAGLCISLPAFATWDGRVIVNDATAQDLQSATLTFETNGQQLPVEVEEDEDGRTILIIGFSGDSATPGTLTISRSGSTPQRIATPAAASGQDISVSTSGPGAASLVPALPVSIPAMNYMPDNVISVSGGLLNVRGADPATSGTLLAAGPGSEVPSLNADYDVNTVGGTIAYSHNFGGGLPSWLDGNGLSSDLTVGVSYGYYTGDETSSFQEPSGARDSGFLITALNPAPDDQTGALVGPFGIQSTANIDVDIDVFEGSLAWSCGRPIFGDATFIPRLSLRYTSWDYELTSRDTFEPAFAGNALFNSRTQSVEQDIFDFGIGGKLIKPLSDDQRFDAFLDSTVRVYYADGELDSTEFFALNNPADVQQRRVSTSDDTTELGFDFGLGLGWNIGENWRAEAEVTAILNTPTAGIENPVRGDGSNPGTTVLPLTRLTYDTQNQWYAGVSVNYGF